jgi:hypothetical protein
LVIITAGEAQQMNARTMVIFAWAAGIAFGAPVTAQAQVLADSSYRARQELIATRYASAYSACRRVARPARGVCIAEARAEDRIARAQLAADYRPSAQARFQALVVAADSRYDVAIARCDLAGRGARKTCSFEAEAARGSAIANANLRLEAANARSAASEQSVHDREEGASGTYDARLAGALEQCAAYVDRTRQLCLAQTRKRLPTPTPGPGLDAAPAGEQGAPGTTPP